MSKGCKNVDIGRQKHYHDIRLLEFMESYSGGYDVITLDMFCKIWRGKGLLELLVDAIDSVELSARSTMKFLIQVTNPR